MPDENDIVFNEYSLDFFAFLSLLLQRLSGNGGVSSGSDGTSSGWSSVEIVEQLSSAWDVFVLLSWMVSFILLFGLVYAYLRHSQLGEVLSEILRRQEELFFKINKKDVKNARWNDVQSHIQSENENDWKLAIIEADVILDELLNTVGLVGVSIGEKLKSASPSNFRTINQAWRAHNIRNRIAHEGGNFELSRRDAKETITQYKMVFDEFDFI